MPTNDATGQRTGFKGTFLEFDLGYTHRVGDALELRPEARHEQQMPAPSAAITGFAYGHGRDLPFLRGSGLCYNVLVLNMNLDRTH